MGLPSWADVLVDLRGCHADGVLATVTASEGLLAHVDTLVVREVGATA